MREQTFWTTAREQNAGTCGDCRANETMMARAADFYWSFPTLPAKETVDSHRFSICSLAPLRNPVMLARDFRVANVS
jgi:hypothetical protein